MILIYLLEGLLFLGLGMWYFRYRTDLSGVREATLVGNLTPNVSNSPNTREAAPPAPTSPSHGSGTSSFLHPNTLLPLSTADLPRDVAQAAESSAWQGWQPNEFPRFVYEPGCSENVSSLSGEAALLKLAQEFGLSEEIPSEKHLVRLDYAFGLPGPKIALLRLAWQGDNPPRYSVETQIQPHSSLATDVGVPAPFVFLEQDLPLNLAKVRVEKKREEWLGEFTKISYRRVLVNSQIPEPPQNPSLGRENLSLAYSPWASPKTLDVLNHRLLYVGAHTFNCQSVGRRTLHCFCPEKPAPPH